MCGHRRPHRETQYHETLLADLAEYAGWSREETEAMERLLDWEAANPEELRPRECPENLESLNRAMTTGWNKS